MGLDWMELDWMGRIIQFWCCIDNRLDSVELLFLRVALRFCQVDQEGQERRFCQVDPDGQERRFCQVDQEDLVDQGLDNKEVV